MIETLSWILPFFTLIISLISITIALFTYRQVSTKHISKTEIFEKRIESFKELEIFNIQGSGSVERMEIKADGRRTSEIILKIDNEIAVSESRDRLKERNSNFLSYDNTVSSPVRTYKFYIEMDMQKRFHKSLALVIDNKKEDTPFLVGGKVYYTLEKKRF